MVSLMCVKKSKINVQTSNRNSVLDTKNKQVLVRAGMSEKVRKIKRYKLPGIK